MAEYRLCSVDELPSDGDGRPYWVDAPHPPGMQLFMANMPEGRRRLIAYQTPEGLRVTNDMCPHQGAPLAGGTLTGSTLTCPWHFWQFDLTDGHCLLADWATLNLYKTSIEGDDVFVTLEDVPEAAASDPKDE